MPSIGITHKSANHYKSLISQRFLAILACLMLFPSCEIDHYDIPEVYVNFYIDLNDPHFFDLRSIGGAVQITGGVNGIIVYRRGIDEFYAFERTSPKRCNDELTVVHLVDNTVYAIDSCSNIKYALIDGGFPMENAASLPLKQYNARYNADSNILYISN